MRRLSKRSIESNRTHWANVAKENGCYSEPFYIQMWVTSSGTIKDSVSHRGGLTSDIVLCNRTGNLLIEWADFEIV